MQRGINYLSCLQYTADTCKASHYFNQLKMKLYKRKSEILRLIKLRESNINTFLQVDKDNNPIIKKRSWSHRPQEQRRLIKGFDNLEEISTNK